MKYAVTILVLAPLVAPAPACADPAASQTVSAQYDKAIAAFFNGDHAVFAAQRPPKQLRVMAEAAGTDIEAVIDAQAAKVTDSLELIDVEYMGLLPDRMEMKETPSGLKYIEVWGESYWRMDENNLKRIISPMIAVEDEESWYLTPVRKPRDVLSLRLAYPGFLGVEFPIQKMETVWENKLPDHLKGAE